MGIFGIWQTNPTSPLASTYAGFPPDIDDWSCDQWKQYYINNKAAYGKAKAQDILNADIANTNSLTSNIQFCKYDCDWVNYFHGEGLDTGNIFSKAYCATDAAVTAVQNTAQTVSNITAGVSSVTQSKVVSVALVAGAAFVAYKVFFPSILKPKKK